SLTTSDAGGSTSGNGSINDTGLSASGGSNGGASPAVPENNQLLGEPNLSYSQLLRLVYYNSTTVPPYHLVWNGIYDLPFGRGKRFGGGVSRFADMFMGGWQLATIGSWRTGNYLSVSGSEYLFGDPTLDSSKQLILTFNGRKQRLYF